jgi:flagellin
MWTYFQGGNYVMRINHNIAALNTYRQLNSASGAQSKSMEKLSSGLRINRAGDDAAGLAISEKMRGQIRGLDMASKNAQDGISLIQTAEGALNETHSILQRMRELAVQSSNDTNTTADRGEIQKEIDQLVEEIDRIGNTTEFNTKKLLNGGAGLGVTFNSETVGGANSDWISITGGNANTQTGTVNITQASSASGATQSITVGAGTAGAQSVSINGTTINYTATATAGTNADALRAAIESVADELGITVGGSGTTIDLTSKEVGSSSSLTFDANAAAIGTAVSNVTTTGNDATITTDTTSGATQITAAEMVSSGNTIKVISGDFEGMEIKLNSSVMSSTANTNLANFDVDSNGTLSMMIGANEGQNMSINISDMRSSALGVNAIDVSNSTSAESAVTTIQSAIDTVSAERSKLGAYQNRLEHTINNLGTSSENLTAAESRVRDVDMAKEMMNQTKNSILSQAAQAMLAQSNQIPQGVLQLLR